MASSKERNDPGALRPQQDEGSVAAVSATMEQAQKMLVVSPSKRAATSPAATSLAESSGP